MKQNRKQIGKRAGAAALSALLLTGAVVPASAAVAPVVDEAFYGTLDYYGGLTEGSVVKSYRTNGNTRIFDVGSYDEVVNLTDRTEPILSGDNVTFELGEDAPKNFYFEGKTAQPYQEMPFRVQLGYRMNGVETEPEDMAGEKGVGEILLDVYPNDRASEYARNNFAMEAMAVLKDSDILSVEAEGAQVQKIGNLVMVLFLVLPGEEQHFTLRIGAEEFSFGGFTFLVQPATLAQLDLIDDIRKAKEETEESYEAITESLDAILDSLDGMGGTLLETAGGLDQLNEARATLSAGKHRVYDEADRTLASMTDVSDSLAPVVEHLKTAKDALSETTEQVTGLSDTVQTLRPDLSSLKTSLSAVQLDLGTINLLIKDVQGDTKAIRERLTDLSDDLTALQKDLKQVQEDTDDLNKAIGKMDDVEKVSSITIGDESYTPDEIREQYNGDVQTLFRLCREAGGYSDAGLSSVEKKEAAFVSFVMDEGNRQTIATNYVMSQALETVKANTIAYLTQTNPAALANTELVEQAVAQAMAEFLASADGQAKVQQVLATLPDMEKAQTAAYLYYEWKDGDGVNAQLTQADQFNDMIKEVNEAIDSLNDNLSTLKKPTRNLLDSLVGLCDGLSKKNGLIEDSQSMISDLQAAMDTVTGYDPDTLHTDMSGLISTAQSLLTTTDTVLEQSKSLTDTVNKYEPEAEKSLDDAVTQVNASVKLLNDLNTFTKTLENLMKAADPDLDGGSEKSLTGLSKTLRQAKKTLDTTDTIRDANSTIEGLIEDKWDEYTGEKNNALNMDADAEMESLTSDENQTPNSIQLILRTQEIKVDEEARAAAEAAAKPQTTFWDRVMRMFRDFAAIFTGD